MPTPPVVTFTADGSVAANEGRCKSVARAIPDSDIFVYGGDVYPDGATLDYEGDTVYDGTYGDRALTALTQGQNLIPKTVHLLGNHEYHTVNAATLKADQSNDYWRAGTPTRLSRSPMVWDASKVDPNAVIPGKSAADAQKIAASHWEHLQAIDLGGWRLLFVDAGATASSDEGVFPTAGDYYNALKALVDATTARRLIVFCHFPKWTSSTSHAEPRTNMTPLWELIADKAVALIAGHTHLYERQVARMRDGALASAQERGCTPIIVGTAGNSLASFKTGYTPAGAVAASSNTRFGYLKLTLTDADSIAGEFVSLGADALQVPSVFDTFTLTSGPQVARPTSDIVEGGWTRPQLPGIAFRGSTTTAASGEAGNATTLQAVLPTGWEPGDACFIHVGRDAPTGTLDTPDGWTLIGTGPVDTADGRSWMFYRELVAGDTDVTLTFGADVWCTITTFAYQNANVSQVATGITAAGTSHVSPTVAVPANGAIVSVIAVDRSTISSNPANYFGEPAGSVERIAWGGSTVAIHVAVADRAGLLAGTYGHTWTTADVEAATFHVVALSHDPGVSGPTTRFDVINDQADASYMAATAA